MYMTSLGRVLKSISPDVDMVAPPDIDQLPPGVPDKIACGLGVLASKQIETGKVKAADSCCTTVIVSVCVSVQAPGVV